MIIFLNEDRPYLNWITHHRQGFVLAGVRKPRLRQLVVHRATCSTVKATPSRRFQFTSGAKLKACSSDRAELEAWAAEQTTSPPQWCTDCQPLKEVGPATMPSGGTSRLGREILDYVLDAAVIHLEHEHPPYHLTVGDIAACFAKTPGQLRSAIGRLIDEGLLQAPGTARVSPLLSPRQIVLPTTQALRTLESFRDESDAALQTELDKLMAE